MDLRYALKVKCEQLLSSGMPQAQVARILRDEGVPKRTVYDWFNAFKARPLPFTEAEQAGARNEIELRRDKQTVAKAQEQGDSYAGKVMSIAGDMAFIRSKAMAEDDGKPDYRLAILAATTESNLIANSAKLMRDMREASKDNVMVHPQIAKFKEDFLAWAEKTGNEKAIIKLFEAHQ